MAKNKSQKNAGNKPKQDTTSPATQITEKTNEVKSTPPVKEDCAIGNKKLQQQIERQAKEEAERKKIAEEKAKQETKNNSGKKKNKKSTPRAQNVNEPKLELQPREPKEEERVFNKMLTEPKTKIQKNSSGVWNVQSDGVKSQCKVEPGYDHQEHVAIISEQVSEIEQQVDVKSELDWGIDTADNSIQELTPNRLIKRDMKSYDASTTKSDNSERTPKRSWGNSGSTYQNLNHSWNEPSTPNEFSSEHQRQQNSMYENKTNNWNDGSFSNNKRQSNDYRDQRQSQENFPRNNRGQQRSDNYYNRDGAKSRNSEPNYGRQDNYSNFSNRRSYDNRGGYQQSFEKNDREFQEFLDQTMQKSAINHGKLSEVKGDLFTADEDYSLAHCVAEDMSMGAGIAKTFRSKFGAVGKLLNQRQKTGGLAVLNHETRFIYYLVTKEQSRGKPTLHTLWQSLKKLQQHVQDNNVTKLAIPQIGCGLDRLDWRTVQQMLEHIFKDIDIKIVVYIWDETVEEITPPKKLLRKCAVIHSQMKLTDIQKETGLVYFGSVDGHETEEFKHLSDKYNISGGYRAPKALTDVIPTIDKNEYIYGLIIKQNYKDDIDYEVVEKTLKNLNKILKKDKTIYIGFEAFVDVKDKYVVDKIVSLMQYTLLDVEIWVCWPDALKEFCPQQNKAY